MSFEEMFSDLEGLKREQTVMKTTVPDLAMDDPLYDYHKSKLDKKMEVTLLRKELVDELLGDYPVDPIHELQAESDSDKQVEALLQKSYIGKRLSRRLKKGMTMEESMQSIFSANQELFTIEQHRLIEKAINCGDIGAFLEIFARSLEVA